tara:strand:+ start:427 stop:813 length:387 start_codon:yes stop_codon:yes gene_type:complete
MAYDLGPQTLISVESGEDMSAWQYKVVFINTSGKAVQFDDGGAEIPAGILQNAPTSGETANILVAGVTRAISDSSFALQNFIAAKEGDGKMTNVIASNYVVGQPITAPGGDGEQFTAMVNFATAYVGS